MNYGFLSGRERKAPSGERGWRTPSAGAFLFMIIVILAGVCLTYSSFGVGRFDAGDIGPHVDVNPHVGEYGLPMQSYEVVSRIIREVTAYNVGIHGQTDSEPCIGATGEDLCKLLKLGKRVCAANGLPLGTLLRIEHYGECVVLDRMNRRYRNRIDIAMNPGEVGRAREFGLQKLQVSVLEEIE